MSQTPLRVPLLALCLSLALQLSPCLAEEPSSAGSALSLKEPAPFGELRMERIKVLRGPRVNSPKSAVFSPDGSRIYVNALEGMETIVYDAESLEELAALRHEFGEESQDLFLGGESTLYDYEYIPPVPESARNRFSGKPVESAFSHGGRYLWVSYYRRSWDRNASSPSAVAVIDTRSLSIVRVIPTGPLPKTLALSPDGKTMAVVHWGDNSVGLLDLSSDAPRDFSYKGLLEAGRRLDLRKVSGDRDSVCGHCLRGAAFSADGRTLFVGRMRSGGLAVFDLEERRLAGVFKNLPAGPRHLVLSPDGSKLYVSSNRAGTVTELDVEKVLENVRGEGQESYSGRSLRVGQEPRTLVLSPDGRLLLVACNRDHELVAVDLASWRKIASAKATPYSVGLALSPDGAMAVTTAQGRKGRGGHALDVFRLTPPAGPASAKAGPEAAAQEGEPHEATPCPTQGADSDVPAPGKGPAAPSAEEALSAEDEECGLEESAR